MKKNIKKKFSKILAQVMKSIDEPVILLDNKNEILYYNKKLKNYFSIFMDKGENREILKRLVVELKKNRKFEKKNLQKELLWEGKKFFISKIELKLFRQKIFLLHDLTEKEKYESWKKDLVTNVSHELRTPLTSIKGFTETLLGSSSNQQKDLLYIIEKNADRMISLVNDTLKLSELESYNENLNSISKYQKIDLFVIVKNICQLLEEKIRIKGLNLTSTSNKKSIIVMGETYLLEQLFINLIENAIKYTDKGSINVSLEKKKEICKIIISDTGVGIHKDNFSRLFERFYVVDKSRSRISGGNGLGLSIVKHIVSKHKGKIKIKSKLNKGSNFIIFLPLNCTTKK